MPAQQRLRADDASPAVAAVRRLARPGLECEQRLVVQAELLAMQRAAQRVLQQQHAGRLRLHFAGEEAVGVAAVLLGPVHGRVGAFAQRVEIVAIGREHRDAHRRRDGQLMLLDLIGRTGQGHQLGREMGGAGDVGLRQHQHELVAAHAGDRVLLAHGAAQPCRELHEQRVTDAVTQRVVDVLEMVQVQEQHRQRLGAAVCDVDGLGCTVGQQMAVGQAGQAVEHRQALDVGLGGLLLGDLLLQRRDGLAQLLGALGHQDLQLVLRVDQLLLGQLARGDVLRDPDRTARQVAAVDGLAAHLAPDRRAVLAAQQHLGLEGLAARQRFVAEVAGGLPVLVAEIPGARELAVELAVVVAEQLLERAVDAGHAAVPQEDDADHGVVEDELLLGAEVLQRGIGQLALVDVVDDPDRAIGRVVRVDQAAGQVGPEQLAVLAPHDLLATKGLAGRQHRIGARRQAARLLLGRIELQAAAANGRLRAVEAVDLRVALVAADQPAGLHEDDAHPGVGQDDVQLTQRLTER
mmetsp:Transcript_6670/g.27828  ORF Transcript_6670/g.27828 Transcript_6670/m.27828 type:complete len:521 (-) Transcript_6670:2987-4549(-)